MTEPFLPVTKPSIDEKTIEMVVEVLRSSRITSGPKVLEFEARLSEYFDGRPVRVFNSGTCALEIALRIIGIGAGTEVITTPISYISTAHAIVATGATPVFVDIDPVTRNIDLDKVEAAISLCTKAIVPVYLSGLPVDLDKLYRIAKKHNLRVVEDAAQALGSEWNGKKIGAFGDLVLFSFQETKNITTADGGALVLNNAEEACLAEKYRLLGITRSGYDGMDVDILSGKFIMTDIAAAIGLGQFIHIDEITMHRRALADHYFTCFGTDFSEKYGVQLPVHDTNNTNWHLFQLVLPERTDGKPARAIFIKEMREKGIGIASQYPAIHLFSLYQARGFKEGTVPIAERVGRLIVSLPMFNTMMKMDVERVVHTVKSVLDVNQQK
ncbi:unnamed protein product [Rotaria sp. Silwood2]|nr:unnamed protein product [Rotaria sp. Silwood2]CAF4093551.1 unnamed protein product [Rotaria sp. Silwood2]